MKRPFEESCARPNKRTCNMSVDSDYQDSPTSLSCELQSRKTGYQNPFANGTFKFYVGSEAQCFDAHIDMVKNVSEPLGRLMTNGSLEESVEKRATIKDVDPDTFALFLEFAYTRNYGAGAEDDPPLVFCCHLCGTCKLSQYYPYCSTYCADTSTALKTGKDSDGKHSFCCLCGGRSACGAGKAQNLLCGDGGLECNTYPLADASSFSNARRYAAPANATSPQGRAYRRFRDLKFVLPGGRMDHESYFLLVRPPDATSDDLMAHAKLWVFAEAWLMDDLCRLCMYKLHQDLVVYSITSSSILQLVELVTYLYENAPRPGKGRETVLGNPTALVQVYLASVSEQLLPWPAFREMIADGGDHVVDLFELISARI